MSNLLVQVEPETVPLPSTAWTSTLHCSIQNAVMLLGIGEARDRGVAETQPDSSLMMLACPSFSQNVSVSSMRGCGVVCSTSFHCWSGHTGRNKKKKSANWFSVCQKQPNQLASCYHPRANEGRIDVHQIKAVFFPTLLIVQSSSIRGLFQHFMFYLSFWAVFQTDSHLGPPLNCNLINVSDLYWDIC